MHAAVRCLCCSPKSKALCPQIWYAQQGHASATTVDVHKLHTHPLRRPISPTVRLDHFPNSTWFLRQSHNNSPLRFVFCFFLSLVNLAICHSLGLRAIIFFLFSFFCIGREIERIRTKGTYTYSMQPKHQTITTMINKNNIGWNDGGQKRRILSVSA